MPGRCQPDADRGGGKGGKGSGKGKTPLPLPPRILAGRGFVGCFSQLARVARVNSSLCTRAHARMHEKNLHLPLPPLPDEVIGRKALLGVGFRGKGKSPAGLPSPLPPLPLPLPSRAYGRFAGASRGTFGWSQRQHQNPPWREIALARNHRRWQKPGPYQCFGDVSCRHDAMRRRAEAYAASVRCAVVHAPGGRRELPAQQRGRRQPPGRLRQDQVAASAAYRSCGIRSTPQRPVLAIKKSTIRILLKLRRYEKVGHRIAGRILPSHHHVGRAHLRQVGFPVRGTRRPSPPRSPPWPTTAARKIFANTSPA